MKSLQEYRNEYRQIAQNLGYHGDSVELLIQLLSNATYIEEVENISYMEESSMEKAHLQNSKIQHCMDLMYSVYRGACPKVYFKFKAKSMKTLTRYTEIATSSNFNVYYYGYLKDIEKEGTLLSEDIEEDDLTILPTQTYIICGFISKAPITKSIQVSYSNLYYIDLPGENLSSHMVIDVEKQGSGNRKNYKVTSDFKEYLLQADNDEDSYIFDLTTTDFGSRIYFKDSYGVEASDTINATYFSYSRLSDFLPNALKKIMISFGELLEWTEFRGAAEIVEKGLLITKESEPENVLGIHYNAARERYQSSVVRSNNDLGDILKRRFKKKVAEASCVFEDKGNLTMIYYIPAGSERLSQADELEFVSDYLAYYITKDINIVEATPKDITLDVNVSLSSVVNNLQEEVEGIVKKYSRSFKRTKEILSRGDEVLNKIRSAISQLPGVNYVRSIEFQGLDLIQEEIEKAKEEGENVDNTYSTIYFNIACVVSSRLD